MSDKIREEFEAEISKMRSLLEDLLLFTDDPLVENEIKQFFREDNNE